MFVVYLLRSTKAPPRGQMRTTNPPHAANPYSSNPGPAHQQQPASQQQRRLKERSSVTSDDATIAMMVFRIGIPDIKQTVRLTRHIQLYIHCSLFSTLPVVMTRHSRMCSMFPGERLIIRQCKVLYANMQLQ